LNYRGNKILIFLDFLLQRFICDNSVDDHITIVQDRKILLADDIIEGIKKFESRLTLDQMKKMLRIRELRIVSKVSGPNERVEPLLESDEHQKVNELIDRLLSSTQEIVDIFSSLPEDEYFEDLDDFEE
jgi:hypothetical protein